jgi:hypothetical protein
MWYTSFEESLISFHSARCFTGIALRTMLFLLWRQDFPLLPFPGKLRAHLLPEGVDMAGIAASGAATIISYLFFIALGHGLSVMTSIFATQFLF